MHQWDSSLFSVTPAASLLSRCVSAGAASQVRRFPAGWVDSCRARQAEIDTALSDPKPVFSSHLQEAEERIRKQKQLDELQLQLELLRVDQTGAEVPRGFRLAQKKERLQTLSDHLLELLKEQKILKQRLMRPLARTNLPVVAHLHRFVVETVKLMMDFIQCLEEKLRSAQDQSATADRLALLDTSCSVMLTLAAETETLSSRILQWKNSSCVTSQTLSSAGD